MVTVPYLLLWQPNNGHDNTQEENISKTYENECLEYRRYIGLFSELSEQL